MTTKIVVVENMKEKEIDLIGKDCLGKWCKLIQSNESLIIQINDLIRSHEHLVFNKSTVITGI